MKQKQVTIEISNNTHPATLEDELIKAAKEKAKDLRKEVEAEYLLSTLHDRLNKELNLGLESVDNLIDRLLPYASTRMRRSFHGVSENGRRRRTTINQQLVEQMKEMASKNTRKAQIAREMQVSYIVVSNAIEGKYDHKFKRK